MVLVVVLNMYHKFLAFLSPKVSLTPSCENSLDWIQGFASDEWNLVEVMNSDFRDQSFLKDIMVSSENSCEL